MALKWLLAVVLLLLLSSKSDAQGGHHGHHGHHGHGALPNFVILYADDLGWGDLSVYGHPTSSTPNLDKMASEGLVFKQYYSASPLCSPSRAALLTGRYQTRSGVYPDVFLVDSTGGLPQKEVTLAEGLQSVGYSTAIVGKWHLGVGKNFEHLPTTQGFDTYYGIPYSHGMCPCTICFYPDKPCFEKCDPSVVPCPIFNDNTIEKQPADYLTLSRSYVDQAKKAIKTAVDKSAPLFLYMAFHQVHNPTYSNEQLTGSSVRLTFGDALSEMDWMAGEIFQALKDYGIHSNTFVFFAGDNGPQLSSEGRGGNPGPLRCGKGTTWEGGQREPAIAWWPGRIAPGSTLELAAALDIFPTVMNLAGAELPDVPLDGVDMAPILFSGGNVTDGVGITPVYTTASIRDSFMFYSAYPKESEGVYAVRWKQYKAHFYLKGDWCGEGYPDEKCRGSFEETLAEPLLFDLHTDPGERHPLDNTEYEAEIATLTKMKKDFDAKMVWGPSQMEVRSPDTEPCAKPGCTPFPGCCVTG